MCSVPLLCVYVCVHVCMCLQADSSKKLCTDFNETFSIDCISEGE